MDKRKLLSAVATALIAVGIAVEPTQAALLDFNFTSATGATGTFTLDTDTPPSGEPALGIGPENPGILYPNAVSNFSFSSPSSPQFNVSGDADWEVIPSIFLGPPGSPVLAGVDYPAGCARETNFTCLINIGVGYAGSVPKLSDDPNSYPSNLMGLGFMLIDPITRESPGIEEFTQFQVVRRQAVPEPNSALSVLAFALGSAGLLLKLKMNRKNVLRHPVSIEG